MDRTYSIQQQQPLPLQLPPLISEWGSFSWISLFFSVNLSMCDVCLWLGAVTVCLWVCDVYEFVCAWERERAPAFIKSVAPALTFTPPPKCFVVFICLPSDTDSIPPPSASVAPLPKCLAEGGDSSTALLPVQHSTVKDIQHQLVTVSPVPISSAALLVQVYLTGSEGGKKKKGGMTFYLAYQKDKDIVNAKHVLQVHLASLWELFCDRSHSGNVYIMPGNTQNR